MDITQLLARPHSMHHGDAYPYLEGFAAEMASVGYAPLTIGGYLDSAIHFGGWLEAQGLSLVDIDEKIVKAFGVHRCQCPGHRGHQGVSRSYNARVQRFVQYLGQQGVVGTAVDSAAEAPSPSSPSASGFCSIGDWRR
jgi:hypothetical protein